jgi:hypothetical protein
MLLNFYMDSCLPDPAVINELLGIITFVSVIRIVWISRLLVKGIWYLLLLNSNLSICCLLLLNSKFDGLKAVGAILLLAVAGGTLFKFLRK